MNPSDRTVALITAGHVSTSPRLVKEADSLVEAGYSVRVVAGNYFEFGSLLDRDVLSRARWDYVCVDQRRGLGVLLRKISRRLARIRILGKSGGTLKLAARAIHSESLRLGKIASRLPADLYIGHSLPGLYAASVASSLRGARFGFDAEDFHDTETDYVLQNPALRRATSIIQRELVSKCVHVTSAAPLIGKQYELEYGVSPTTVLNVFPRSYAPHVPVDVRPISEENPAEVYWFSQTIGEGRGLEETVRILGLLRTPSVLRLRGFSAAGYVTKLRKIASDAGMKREIEILPAGEPSEMARLAAGAHLGLSTEVGTPPNRNICLTNKIFVYLLAGIPQMLSRTAAQIDLAPNLGEAALLIDLKDPRAAANRLDHFFGSAEDMRNARRKARELAMTRYCWEVEQHAFLASVAGALR